jgi:hypothetical protein
MKEPSYQISQFCKAMDTWANACMTPLPDDDDLQRAWRKKFKAHWQFLRLAIVKSNLLYRLLYAGEELRTEPCPKHKGHWSGCSLDVLTSEGIVLAPSVCACQHEENITGWLPKDVNGLGFTNSK